MPTLTRSQTVMDLACATEGCACRTVGVDGMVQFLQLDGDTQQIRQTVGIPVEKFDDLGRPDTITVAITPGDLLNP